MKANRINDILTECNHYQNVSMEIWKRITLTHIDREFSTKVRAICNEGKEAIKENYTIVCEQLNFVRQHTELEPTYRRDIIEYYDMLLNVYGSLHTSFQMYCELADKAQSLPVKDVIEQMEQIRQRVRNKLNTIKKYVGSLRENEQMEMTPKEAENIIKKTNKFCDKLQYVLQTVCHDDYVQVSVYSINTEPGTEEAEIKAGIEIPSYDLTMSYTIGRVWDYRDGVVGCPEYDDLCIKVLEFFCAIVGEYVATIPKL